MQDILQISSPECLIPAIEANLSSWLPVFGNLGTYYADNPPGVKRAITDIPSALMNSVMDARLAPGETDETIQAILSDASTRKVPILWWIGPSSRPSDLSQRLEQHGFSFDDDTPGMWADLASLNESLPVPPGLSFQLAEDDASRQQWSLTMARANEVPPSSVGLVQDCWTRLLLLADPGTTFAYTAYLQGEPVATSLLFLAAGVAGIYSVATVPEARRKGIGAQVTLYPLLQARSMGYRIGVLQASEMGHNVYRSLSFQEFCRVQVYRWKPS